MPLTKYFIVFAYWDLGCFGFFFLNTPSTDEGTMDGTMEGTSQEMHVVVKKFVS